MNYKNNFLLGKKILISKNSKTYIIAEAGVAHFGSIKKAYKLVDLAKYSGADAVKFQGYKTDELVDSNFKNWYNRYKIKEVNFQFLEKLKNYCKKKKITFLCTPHTETAISWIKKLKVPLVKIGSGELNNFDFLSKIIRLNRPVIISTGMYSLIDLKNLNIFFKKKKFNKVIFLKCSTVYPSDYDILNLNNFDIYKKIFKNALIGYSDHSKDDLTCITAVSMGYKVIEKHISLDFNIKNAQDWKVSLNKNQLKKMIQKIRLIEIIKGINNIKIGAKEKKNKLWATKSLYFKELFKSGHIIKRNDIISMRPGNGISPLQIKQIIGKKIKTNLKNKKIRFENIK